MLRVLTSHSFDLGYHLVEIGRFEMKLTLALLLILPIAGCTVVPVGSSGKAGGGTALVCHKGKKTMELPKEAVQGHLDHGDRLGPC